MNYVSVDIETTGLDEEHCQILQVCAIIDNGGELNKLPRFDFKIRRDFYEGEPYAFAMHTRLLRQLAAPENDEKSGFNMFRYYNIDVEENLVLCYKEWLMFHEVDIRHHNVAGKNFAGFDRAFLKKINRFPLGRYRVIDVGNLFLRPDDEAVPNTIECCARAGIKIDKSRQHDALYDCEIVIRLIRAWGEMRP